MSKLIQKVKWNLDGLNTEMYMYGEADFEVNKSMQEPLEKLYQYENQPNMREKVVEYIGELGMEIKRLEDHLEEHMNDEACRVTEIETRMETLQEVINDLKGRLEERI
jgi:DNA repair ATPase RecN